MRRSLPLLALLLSSVAQAATHHVPGQYATIQGAIDAAVAGDSVLVAPGIYTGQDRTGWVCANWLTQNVVADLKPGLVLLGTGGPEVTILSGVTTSTYGVRTLRLTTQDGPPTRVEGFTITGDKIGIAIGCTDSEVTIRNCHITNNPNMGLEISTAAVTVEDCLFAENDGQGASGALRVGFGGVVRVFRTHFEDNMRGGVTAASPTAQVILEECEFVNHKGSRAVIVMGCPDVQIRNSLFLGNKTTDNGGDGPGVRLEESSGVVEFCTFAYDSAMSANGAAIHVGGTASAVEIRNNTFFRCYSPGVGGAVTWAGLSGSVHGNVITECSAGALAFFGGSTAGGCNMLWANTSDYYQWPAEAMVGDLEMDPLLCDPESLDLSVESGSPAAAPPGFCDPMGAHGVGCGPGVNSPEGIETRSFGRIKSAYREPGQR